MGATRHRQMATVSFRRTISPKSTSWQLALYIISFAGTLTSCLQRQVCGVNLSSPDSQEQSTCDSHRCTTCCELFVSLSKLKQLLPYLSSDSSSYLDEEETQQMSGQRLSRMSQLKRCALIDGGKRLQKCNVCGKGFTQIPNLTRHTSKRECAFH